MVVFQLKALLTEREMSQRELSRRTKIRQHTINQIYNNDLTHVPLIAIEQICTELHIGVEDLMVIDRTRPQRVHAPHNTKKDEVDVG